MAKLWRASCLNNKYNIRFNINLNLYITGLAYWYMVMVFILENFRTIYISVNVDVLRCVPDYVFHGEGFTNDRLPTHNVRFRSE